jgi:hypothetical protein
MEEEPRKLEMPDCPDLAVDTVAIVNEMLESGIDEFKQNPAKNHYIYIFFRLLSFEVPKQVRSSSPHLVYKRMHALQELDILGPFIQVPVPVPRQGYLNVEGLSTLGDNYSLDEQVSNVHFTT